MSPGEEGREKCILECLLGGMRADTRHVVKLAITPKPAASRPEVQVDRGDGTQRRTEATHVATTSGRAASE